MDRASGWRIRPRVICAGISTFPFTASGLFLAHYLERAAAVVDRLLLSTWRSVRMSAPPDRGGQSGGRRGAPATEVLNLIAPAYRNCLPKGMALRDTCKRRHRAKRTRTCVGSKSESNTRITLSGIFENHRDTHHPQRWRTGVRADHGHRAERRQYAGHPQETARATSGHRAAGSNRPRSGWEGPKAGIQLSPRGPTTMAAKQASLSPID
jgi:hypothetical protein